MAYFYLEEDENLETLVSKITEKYFNNIPIRDFLLQCVVWEKCEFVEKRWRAKSPIYNAEVGYWEIYEFENMEYSDEDNIIISHFSSQHDDFSVSSSEMKGNLPTSLNFKFKGKIVDR